MEWIKRWGYFDLYDEYYFNEKEIGGADSKVENVGLVKPSIHIDDNWETVVALASNYPKMEVWYFNPSKSPFDKGDLENIKSFEGWSEIVDTLGKSYII
jgi:hypothetical protein